MLEASFWSPQLLNRLRDLVHVVGFDAHIYIQVSLDRRVDSAQDTQIGLVIGEPLEVVLDCELVVRFYFPLDRRNDRRNLHDELAHAVVSLAFGDAVSVARPWL